MERSIVTEVFEEAQDRLREAINHEADGLGWAIIDTSFDTADRASRYQLQKDCDMIVFRNDAEVHDHVFEHARQNPESIQRRAIEWLKRNSPDEYRFIRSGFPRDSLPLRG